MHKNELKKKPFSLNTTIFAVLFALLFFAVSPLKAQPPAVNYTFKQNQAFITADISGADYTIDHRDNRLIITFSKPIAHIFNNVLNGLQGLAVSSDISQDDKSITIDFNRPFDSQNYIKNNRLIIELTLPEQINEIEAAVNSDKTTPVIVESARSIKDSVAISSPQIPTHGQERIASLSFPWNVQTNIAVFERGKYLWIIFDHSQKTNIEEIQKTAGDLATDIFQFPHPTATIIRMTPRDKLNTLIRREGLLWIVDISRGELPNQLKDMPLFTQYDSLKNAYLFVPTSTAGNIIPTIDPEVGDVIMVAPTSDIGTGFSEPYQYPEFEILKSQQGLAIVNDAPDIMINRGNSGLTLKAAGRSLHITPDLELQKRHKLLSKNADNSKFNIHLPPNLLNQNFNDTVDALKQDIIKADPQDKNKATLELVKYYIAKGLGTNALKLLNEIKEKEAPEVKTEIFHALSGVANFLARRYPEAIKEFEYGELPQIDEAVFWRTLASSALEYKKENNIILFSYISLIRDYPQELRDRIAVIGAQTAINSNDDISAQNFIDVLKTSNDSLIDRTPVINYLYAQKLTIQGYPLNAAKEFRNISRSPSMLYSSLARYETATLGQKLNLVSVKDAIGELEKLRFAWNEKKFRFALLNTLANLYVKNKDYYNALNTIRDALPLTDEEGKTAIKKKMVSWFEDVFVHNQADEMSPFKSLALYQDYEWLAPQSQYYNAIVTKLADRLVAVDLLGRAAEILNNQLKQKQLTDEERGKIGTRLALISLFDNNSPAAIEILDTTEYPDLSETLQSHRRVIRARALANAGETKEALRLLKDDMGKNAILLKSELYWNSGMWEEASDTLQYLIEKPVPGKPLSLEQIGYILDWATALKQAKKEAVLVRVRNKFLPYFEKTKYYSAFSVLTNHLETNKIDLKAINKAVNDIQAFSNFARIYNDSLKITDIK